MKKYQSLSRIAEQKAVAIIRSDSKDLAIKSIDAVYQGGLRVIEVTLGTPGALEIIKYFKDKYANSILMGAGSVLDSETARLAILAGAEYIVAPNLDFPTIKTCNRYSIPIMPGIYTTTEMVQAMELGVDVVKLFPASSFEPGIIKAFKGPIPNAKIMPTGGVGLANARKWLEAGAFALGIGGSLTKMAVNGKFSEVTAEARKYVDLIEEFKRRE